MARICQMCGMSNSDSTEFCAACGSSLLEKENAQITTRRGVSENAKTAFGMPAAGISDPPPKPSNPPMAKPSNPPTAKPSNPPMAKPSNPPMATAGETKASQKSREARTVLGMVAVTSKPPMAKVTQPVKTDVPEVQKDKHTVLGIPAVSDTKSSEGKRDPLEVDTLTDSEAIVESEVDKPRKEEFAKQRAADRKTPLDIPKVREDAARKAWKSEHDEWPDEKEPKSGPGLGLLVGVALGAVVVIAVAAVLIYTFILKEDSSLTPQVFSTADGNAVKVVFSFPKAPPGSSIQVVGKTVPINGGQASLEIPLSDLQLGVNDLKAIYLEPNGHSEEKSFSIVLRHSVTNDLSGLAAKEPFVVVDFKIADGMSLTVDGKPAQLTDGGHIHKIPLAELAASAKTMGENLIGQVAFQLIDANGAVEQGQHVIAVPLTKLQIDRPADKAIVDTDTVTCAGTTEEGAEVTVNKKPVGVTVAGFLTSVALPTIGDHPISITSRAPGKAPNTRTVKVTRLLSLLSAIDEWAGDMDAKLDYPTIGRDPNAHANKKVKLSGTIANIKTEKGVTAMLLYIAQSCPKGNLCAVYVVFRGETDAGLHSWVDVYGLVKGTRTIDLQSGKRDVPYIEAEFVIKSEREKKRGG